MLNRKQHEGEKPVAGLLDRLLRMPIFYKVLLANSLIVVTGATIGTYLTTEHVRAYPNQSHEDMIALFVLVGLAVSLVVNFVVLQAALLPLKVLARTVEEVRQGNFRARARKVRVNDPQVDQLTDTLNGMLDEVEAYREEVQKLSSQAISAQEEERKRVARELHDETAQSLTSLLVRLRIAEKAGSVEEIRAAIAEVRELTARTLEEVRKLALELRPSALDDLGLVPALQWYTKQYAERHGVVVDFRSVGLDERLPAEMELVLYRVIQEALTNVAKHAQAQRVEVMLQRQGGVIRASVQDDGRGFDAAAMLQSRERGLGLFGMQERLALVGGHFHVESAIRQGTRIDAEVPLDKVWLNGRAGAQDAAVAEAAGAAGGGSVDAE